MEFNAKDFFESFCKYIDNPESYKVSAKTDNAIDTLRVFMAVDYACLKQVDFFGVGGTSYWRGNENGEFLCDYTYHYNYKIIIALESEWGTATSSKSNTEKIVYDFRKIINMASPIKIMVFAYTNIENKKKTMSEMSEILKFLPLIEKDCVILISCPWNDALCRDSVHGYIWSSHSWVTI